MTVAVALVLYAVALARTAERRLANAAWTRRNPIAGIRIWQAATLSSLLAVVLAGLALASASPVLLGGTSDLLNVCGTLLRTFYGDAGPAVVGSIGLMASTLVILRLGGVLSVSLWKAYRNGRAHADLLALVGTPDPRYGVTVVKHDVAAAYCLPGPHGNIVVTSAARDALDSGSFAAVLAHERAHLKARHHLVVLLGDGLARACPFSLFKIAAREVRHLVELAADDAALLTEDRHDLAHALHLLTKSQAPTQTLGAGGGDTRERAQRLTDIPQGAPQGILVKKIAVLSTPALLLTPLILFAAPVALALAARFPSCPVLGHLGLPL